VSASKGVTKVEEVRVLAATGMLGSGFSEETFLRALQSNPHVIGCDAGSTDPGPYYLGSGIPMSSREAVKRDLTIMIKGGLKQGIPVLVGSAGTAGGSPHLEWTANIVREIAVENDLHFKLALIEAEMNKDTLVRYMEQGKLKELYPAPVLSREGIERLERVVGMMGPEPYIHALEAGAQVVIAGRSSDTSIFSAVPIMHGLNHGPTWHSAKILECGAGCVEHRLYPDCMMTFINEDSFRVEPPNPEMRCTPVSVVSHTLYENANPYELVEPSGILDTTHSEYRQDGDRGVIVVGSEFRHSDAYTIRIEGVEKIGYRHIAVGGIRDPIVLKQLDSFLDGVKKRIGQKVKTSIGLNEDEFRLQFRVYGDSGTMGKLELQQFTDAHEVGVAETEEQAQSIMSIAWHTALHHPIPEWSGLVSQIAFPYSPPSISTGAVYRFALNHVIEVSNPLDLFPIRYEEL
jgi:protein-tyrosine-phosphatase